MIKLTEIRDSAVGVIAALYPDKTIYDERQQQGMNFPCFFVQIIPVYTRRYRPESNRDRTLLSIKYFTDSESTLECLEVKEKLDTVLSKTLNVSGNVLSIQSVEIDVKKETVGNSLDYMITLDYFNAIEEEEIYLPMDDVQIDF